MRKRIIYTLTLLMFSLCGLTHAQIKIQGKISGITANKLYLIDAYQFQRIDSTDYKNDQFTFFLSNKKGKYEPKLVSIVYYTGKQVHIFAFSNPYLKPLSTAFMLEDGLTTITGQVTKENKPTTDPLQIQGGAQTTAYFKTYMSDYGFLGTKDPAERKMKLDSFIAFTKLYPDSYYLLDQLHVNRQTLTTSELNEIAPNFDLKLRSSKRGVEIFESIKTLSHEVNLNSLVCKAPNGKSVDVLKDKTKPQVLIFWASWCMPCRNEIPYLKKIIPKYAGKFKFTSISMDTDNLAWQSALANEKMAWQQYIVYNKEHVKDNFRFINIPLILVIKDQKIIKRYDGFSEKEMSDLESSLQNI